MLISNVHIFDGEKQLEGLYDVVTDGELIKSVEPRTGERTAGCGDVISGNGNWLMPGLIDLHVHLTWNGKTDPATDIMHSSPEENLMETVGNTLKYLSNGVTSVRDLGSPNDDSLHVSKAIARGQIRGPRIFGSGMSLIMTGGHDPFHGMPVDGPWEALKGVRKQVAKGASVIKISATGGVYGRAEGEGVDDTELRQEELDMIIDEAHRRGIPVTAHALGEKGIRSCLKAGIDCIEHGHYIQRDMAELMAKQGTALVPTFFIYSHLADSDNIPEYARKKSQAVIEAHHRSLGYAKKAGVLIGAGSDAGSPNAPHPCMFEEIKALHDGGLTNEEALRAATGNAAHILRRSGKLGAVKSGAYADLIITSENPCENLDVLLDLRMVIANGEIVKR